MSSMTRLPFLALALVSTTSITPPALAQDAVKLEILRTGQQGTADPALVVLPQQAIASLDVTLRSVTH